MSLRRQLLLVSLLLLSLPWAGCQFIREMEGALRQGQEQALLATATAVGATRGRGSSTPIKTGWMAWTTAAWNCMPAPWTNH